VSSVKYEDKTANLDFLHFVLLLSIGGFVSQVQEVRAVLLYGEMQEAPMSGIAQSGYACGYQIAGRCVKPEHHFEIECGFSLRL
jgi:hypothetical protein